MRTTCNGEQLHITFSHWLGDQSPPTHLMVFFSYKLCACHELSVWEIRFSI